MNYLEAGALLLNGMACNQEQFLWRGHLAYFCACEFSSLVLHKLRMAN